MNVPCGLEKDKPVHMQNLKRSQTSNVQFWKHTPLWVVLDLENCENAGSISATFK